MALRDLYPAEIQLPDGSIVVRGRLILDREGEARVYEMFQGEPRLRYQGLATIIGERGTMVPNNLMGRQVHLAAETADGPLRVNNVGGCECGGAYRLRNIPGEPVYGAPIR